MLDYVGPGGAPSIIEAADTVLFIGKWMQGARVRVDRERLHLDKPGEPKLREHVDEITFNGAVGLARGKKIFYVTDLAVLELTDAGLTLRSVMPGIDIERDLLANGGTHPMADTLELELRKMLDPEAVDARSKADQAAHIEKFGGVEAVRKEGMFARSPIPGAAVELERADSP